MPVKSTVRVGAVSITSKFGVRVTLRPSDPESYARRIAYIIRYKGDRHECDFEGTKIDDSGVKASVCACGRVRYEL
jgi:hypothetical protein